MRFRSRCKGWQRIKTKSRGGRQETITAGQNKRCPLRRRELGDPSKRKKKSNYEEKRVFQEYHEA